MVRLALAAVAATALSSSAAVADSSAQITLTQLGGAGFTFTGQFFPKLDASGTVVDFDARVSYVYGGNVFNVTVVDRRAYASAAEVATDSFIGATCLASSQVPSVASLLDAFLHPSVSTSDELDCADGSQPVAFTFSDNAYAFCAKTATIPASIGDARATVALLLANSEASPSRDVLADDHIQLSSCREVVYSDADLVPQERERQLQAQADCTCKGGKKACLFIHGMGLSADGPALDEYSKCWGDIKTQAACCSSMKFMQMDTVKNAWHSDYLAKKVCETAISMAPAGSNPMALEGLAFVGHSMGNLVVANAELKGYCALGSTSKWISLAGPFLGSQSANFALGACSSSNSAAVATLSFFGLCPIGDTIASLPYIYSNRSSATLNALYEKAGAIYRKKVSSNLCGVSSTGLTSTRSIQYSLLGSISGHATSENDGAVHILSCQAGLDASKYSTTWSGGNFYKADINHGDSSFVTGDGVWGDARKPIKWFNCQF